MMTLGFVFLLRLSFYEDKEEILRFLAPESGDNQIILCMLYLYANIRGLLNGGSMRLDTLN